MSDYIKEMFIEVRDKAPKEDLVESIMEAIL